MSADLADAGRICSYCGMSDEDTYRGAATILAGDRAVAAQVHLRGHFEPIDGRFHWYGRVAVDDAVTALARSNPGDLVLRTAQGEAQATLGDPDPWGRLRITGIGRPPFAVELTKPDTLA